MWKAKLQQPRNSSMNGFYQTKIRNSIGDGDVAKIALLFRDFQHFWIK
jgi:hypothetical protein